MDYFVKRFGDGRVAAIARADGPLMQLLGGHGWVDWPELVVSLQEPSYDTATPEQARDAAAELALAWPS